MNIMFNISSMASGGAERVIANLSNILIKENDIEILVNTKKNSYYDLDSRIRVLELDSKRDNIIIRNIKRIINTKKIICREKPDIIISFLPVPSFRILLLKRKFKNIPIIISDRNNPKEEYKTLINKILMNVLYKRADGFVFQTKEQRQYFNKKIQDKSIIIHNPIKDEFLTESKEEIKKDKTIITVGRLVEQKNQKMLINAFSKIVDQYSDYNLKIFGDGPLKSDLQDLINKLKLDNNIQLCGISNDIKKELKKAEIFVLSSDYEGMPNALIEAMVLGIPCISTDCPCGGPMELIENNKSGILIKTKNEKELVESLKKLLNNKELGKELGKNAKKIREELNINKIANQWKNYIKKIKAN